MVETDEVKPAPAHQEETDTATRASADSSNAAKTHKPQRSVEARAGEVTGLGHEEEGEGERSKLGFLTCSFDSDDCQQEQEHVVDMDCEERQSDVEEEDDKDHDNHNDVEEERSWIQRFEAVSTRGRTHTVGLRELRRLVTLDHRVFGAGSWSLRCFKRYVRRMQGAGFVAVIDGEVVGVVLHVATGKARRAEVANVAVLDEYRQMGIASKLLRLVLNELPARGYDTAKLHVASRNVAAQSLYLKMGFVQTDYKENYYHEDEDRDAVVMQLQFAHEQQDICCPFV